MPFHLKTILNILSPKGDAFGLDIGSFSVKVARFRKGRGRAREISWAVANISQGGDKDAIIAAIKQCLQISKIPAGPVNISLSGEDIVMRYILLPRMPEKDLIHSLEFELSKYIPHKLENTIIDYQIIDRALGNQMSILVIAAERKVVLERVELIRQAGLAPQSINVDSFAIVDAFAYVASDLYKSNKFIALLDIGHKISKLVVLENGILRFSRDIMIGGGYDLTRAISERMGMDFAEAEKMKCSREERTRELSEIIKLNLISILDEVRVSFDYCERIVQRKISALYLSGGGARLKDIRAFLSSSLQIDVNFWNPLSKTKPSATKRQGALSVDKQGEESEGSLLPVAVGLAL